jgi:hypothetical protein
MSERSLRDIRGFFSARRRPFLPDGSGFLFDIFQLRPVRIFDWCQIGPRHIPAVQMPALPWHSQQPVLQSRNKILQPVTDFDWYTIGYVTFIPRPLMKVPDFDDFLATKDTHREFWEGWLFGSRGPLTSRPNQSGIPMIDWQLRNQLFGRNTAPEGLNELMENEAKSRGYTPLSTRLAQSSGGLAVSRTLSVFRRERGNLNLHQKS